MNLIVLLTATVTPQSSRLLTVTDPDQRAEEYRASIDWWIDRSSRFDFALAIAENSGYPVGALLPKSLGQLANVKALSVAPPTADEVCRGKGASEGSLIRNALPSLGLRRDDLLVKVTGRLAVRNFPRCLPRIDSRTAGVVDLPRHDRRWIDSRAFGGTGAYWHSHLVRLGSTADDRDGRNFEHELGELVAESVAQPSYRLQNFSEKPWFTGRSGTTGLPYGSGVRSVMRHSLLMPIDRARRAVTD